MVIFISPLEKHSLSPPLILQVKVKGLMVLLVQEMVYACNLGEEDECRKKEILVVSDQLVPEEVAEYNLVMILMTNLMTRWHLESSASSAPTWPSAKHCQRPGSLRDVNQQND